MILRLGIIGIRTVLIMTKKHMFVITLVFRHESFERKNKQQYIMHEVKIQNPLQAEEGKGFIYLLVGRGALCERRAFLLLFFPSQESGVTRFREVSAKPLRRAALCGSAWVQLLLVLLCGGSLMRR